MDDREIQLLSQLRAHGVTPQLVDNLPHGWRGAYSKQRGEVYIRSGMATTQRVSALAHELIHVRRGHDGHQDKRTEEYVQRKAALEIVPAAAYMTAELLFEGNVVNIARELDVTPAIIRAYQIERSNCLTCGGVARRVPRHAALWNADRS